MAEKLNVFKVYDRLAQWFSEVRSTDLAMELHHLDRFTSYLKPGAAVLDVGCGNGKPIAVHLLSKGFKVTGIDASVEMLEKARVNIPEATILQMDMRCLIFAEKFDGIIMWHSSFHLPTDDQINLIPSLAQNLNPGGVLMFTSGTTHGEVWGNNNGEELYHASLSTQEYHALLEKNGFEVLSHIVEDPKAGGATVWLACYIGES